MIFDKWERDNQKHEKKAKKFYKKLINNKD